MIGMCGRCDRRETCEGLCPEAEKWAGRDYVAQRDFIPPVPISLGEERISGELAGGPEPEEVEPLGEAEWRTAAGCGMYSRQRECLYLYYWARFSQADIARALGISQPGVSMALKKARERLRGYLRSALVIGEIRRITRNREDLADYYLKIESILSRYTSEQLYPPKVGKRPVPEGGFDAEELIPTGEDTGAYDHRKELGWADR